MGLVRIAVAILVAVVALAMAGCAAVEIREAYAINAIIPAPVDGFKDVRFWADAETPQLREAIVKRAEQEKIAAGGKPVPFNALALSGGADDGAFGAGFLVGWTERGDRPQFNVVTGVSTGALIAPLAFLGPMHDNDLMRAFTQVSAAGIFKENGLLAGLIGESLTSTEPLQQLVAQFVDDKLVAEIAAEHVKGRRLRVLTTNLDAQRPVAWDLGEIAMAGGPKALKLIRDCVVASASVPGVFPPVMIEAHVDGKLVREMHVDGGTTRTIFMVPPNTNLKNLRWANAGATRPNLYVIFNGRLDPEFAVVERRTVDIAKRAISTLIKSHGQSTLRELQAFAEKEKAVFRIVSMGPDFKEVSPEPFNQAFMNKLFVHGRELGKSGQAWK